MEQRHLIGRCYCSIYLLFRSNHEQLQSAWKLSSRAYPNEDIPFSFRAPDIATVRWEAVGQVTWTEWKAYTPRSESKLFFGHWLYFQFCEIGIPFLGGVNKYGRSCIFSLTPVYWFSYFTSQSAQAIVALGPRARACSMKVDPKKASSWSRLCVYL
jgi:hypothetical protein